MKEKEYKKWQDEDKTTIWEKLLWLTITVVCCLYITYGHGIINNYLIDIIG